MAKKINLPKTTHSSKGDLLTVIQNGVEKNISKQDLLDYLEASIKSMITQISSLNSKFSKTVSSESPTFGGPVGAATPHAPYHLATKRYVDTHLANTIKIDGTTKLSANLSYISPPSRLSSNDVVPKEYVDQQLKRTLKTVRKLSQSPNAYPLAVVGDTFLITAYESTFAKDGPEVQEGDILICITNSKGGTHGAVGHQFAIINTNVVFATESSAGILRVASEEDLKQLETNDAAITPFKYKRALETGSEYNRTVVNASTHKLETFDKGIIGVDCRNNAVRIILPSIKRITNPKLTKFTFKDEHGFSLKNNITVEATGGDTIQGSRTYLINTDGASAKIYNDGEGKWLLESSLASGANGGGGVKNFTTDNITTGERASAVTTSSGYTSVISIDVDLRDYPIGTGFKVVCHSSAASNGNTKTVAIGIDGTQTLKSSLTGTTAPNGVFIHQEGTLINSNTAKYFIFGEIYSGADDTAAGLTNNIDITWDRKIIVSADVNVPSAVNDIGVFALQVIPLK